MRETLTKALQHLSLALTTRDRNARVLATITARNLLQKELDFIDKPVEEVACGNCDYVGKTDNHNQTEISSFHERVDAGEIVPYGECPKCGALLHAKRPE